MWILMKLEDFVYVPSSWQTKLATDSRLLQE
jgi:hypothetical protein